MSRRSRASFAVAVTLAALVSGCARKKRAPLPVVRPIGSVETGVASWYGHPYHGRAAANGEIYDMETMVAAHRTLPFGAWVRVENLTNRKTVEVRIIDRGPFVDGRIIDLSHAAARAIDLIGPGTAKVLVTVIAPPADAPATNFYAVQVGAFGDRARAERVRGDLEERYGDARLVYRPGNPGVWRVLVGRESTIDLAAALAEKLKTAGSEAFVVRLDEAP